MESRTIKAQHITWVHGLRLKPKVCFVIFWGVILTQSCVEHPEFKEAYRVAGFNKNELKKVVSHFKEDSIKSAATRFLISNMDIHYHYYDAPSDKIIADLADKQEDREARADAMILSGIEEHRSLPLMSNSKKRFDAREIKASVLIEHVDKAVSTWQSSPYAAFITFDQFCELLLPLKTNNSEPINWWTPFDREFQWLKDSLQSSSYPPYIISLYHNVLQRDFGDFFPFKKELNPVEINSIFSGDCRLAAALETAVFRVCGLPTGHFYVPWANHHGSHHFAASLNTYNEWVIAQFFSTNEQDLLCRDKKIAKIFMWLYGKQALNFKAFAEENGIPDNAIPRPLRRRNMIDVTGQFIPTSDAIVTIKNKKPKRAKAVFLCFFSNPQWREIDWAPLSGNSVSFKDLGKDLVYLPMFYDKNNYLPAGDPFILSLDGESKTIKADLGDTIEIMLSRKYPIREPTMNQYAQPMINSVIELANDPAFSKQAFSYKITAPIQTDFDFTPENRDRLEYEMFWQSISVDPGSKYQYLRYKSAPSIKCLIGEIEVLDEKGNKLKGTYSGSGPNPEYISDGVPGQNYRDDSLGGWVIIDIGKPVSISEIRYIVAEDSNAVEPGDEYELFYWDDHWISLGKQLAKERALKFKGPANGLYWIRNHTRGEEERIFTYEDKPVWW